jgi:hypothetical protein
VISYGYLYQLDPDEGEVAPSLNDPSVDGFLASIFTSYGRKPVVRSLGQAVQESNLTRRLLERLLDAREADRDIQQLSTVDNAIMYAEDSSSSLLYLTLECCGVREEQQMKWHPMLVLDAASLLPFDRPRIEP